MQDLDLVLFLRIGAIRGDIGEKSSNTFKLCTIIVGARARLHRLIVPRSVSSCRGVVEAQMDARSVGLELFNLLYLPPAEDSQKSRAWRDRS